MEYIEEIGKPESPIKLGYDAQMKQLMENTLSGFSFEETPFMNVVSDNICSDSIAVSSVHQNIQLSSSSSSTILSPSQLGYHQHMSYQEPIVHDNIENNQNLKINFELNDTGIYSNNDNNAGIHLSPINDTSDVLSDTIKQYMEMDDMDHLMSIISNDKSTVNSTVCQSHGNRSNNTNNEIHDADILHTTEEPSNVLPPDLLDLGPSFLSDIINGTDEIPATDSDQLSYSTQVIIVGIHECEYINYTNSNMHNFIRLGV